MRSVSSFEAFIYFMKPILAQIWNPRQSCGRTNVIFLIMDSSFSDKIIWGNCALTDLKILQQDLHSKTLFKAGGCLRHVFHLCCKYRPRTATTPHEDTSILSWPLGRAGGDKGVVFPLTGSTDIRRFQLTKSQWVPTTVSRCASGCSWEQCLATECRRRTSFFFCHFPL